MSKAFGVVSGVGAGVRLGSAKVTTEKVSFTQLIVSVQPVVAK